MESTPTSARSAFPDIPINLPPEEFRRLGYRLVDQITRHFESLRSEDGSNYRAAITSGASISQSRQVLGQSGLPKHGLPADKLLEQAASMLMEHSIFPGHPRFWGYVTSSPAPIGALADLLAAAINQNVGLQTLAPLATEIERQTVAWIAELVGMPAGSGGLLVSGGNMANMVGFWAARRAKAPWEVRVHGLRAGPPLAVYATRATHTWLQKAVDLAGLGTDAIHWVPMDSEQRMDVGDLERQIDADRQAGWFPFLVVTSAGTVGTGSVDPLPAIAPVCRRLDVWLHVDGAYGAPAAALPQGTPAVPDEIHGLALADSVAIDPHKWLYTPLEAACTLVRDPETLVDAFSFCPEYYNYEDGGDQEEQPLNYYEYGLQNSRAFRALKVWLGLQQMGREGIRISLERNIALAGEMLTAIRNERELEAFTHNLSIVTFRYAPADLRASGQAAEERLNRINQALLNRLQSGGEVFVSNTVLKGKFLLRACIVNFRTTSTDVQALPGIVVREGRKIVKLIAE